MLTVSLTRSCPQSLQLWPKSPTLHCLEEPSLTILAVLLPVTGTMDTWTALTPGPIPGLSLSHTHTLLHTGQRPPFREMARHGIQGEAKTHSNDQEHRAQPSRCTDQGLLACNWLVYQFTLLFFHLSFSKMPCFLLFPTLGLSPKHIIVNPVQSKYPSPALHTEVHSLDLATEGNK